jgi:HJR/Mrr/RecB family endonuclease
MSRGLKDITDGILGLAIWCWIIAALTGLSGAYRIALAAASIGVIGFFAYRLLPRITDWRANREPCPHGIKGGLRLELCSTCIEAKQRAEYEQQKRIEAQAEQAHIRLAAKELTESETARLAKSIVPSLDDLRRISPQRFEDEIACLFERLGYKVQQTPYTNDLGRDAILEKDGKKYLLECKRYGETNTIGRPHLQKFHSAIVSDGALGGFFVTTGTFTTGAKKHATKIGILLIDGVELVRYLTKTKQPSPDAEKYWSICILCGAKVAHSVRSSEPAACVNGHLVDPAISIDDLIGNAPAGAAPLCSRCGKPMRLINGKKGRFWGCSQYPRCRSSRPWRVSPNVTVTP